MKLVILYGAPAVGKLSVAKAVAKIADIKIFDNHKIIDVIEPLVGRDNPRFQELIYRTHTDILKTAAAASTGNIITTFAYAANVPDDVRFMSELYEICESVGAQVYAVQLIAKEADLMLRVDEQSRKQYGKITNKKVMNDILKQYDFVTKFTPTAITLNTSKLTVAESAQYIIDKIY